MKFIKALFILLSFTSSIVIAEATDQKEQAPMSQEDISPNEDLMREHGILNRLLLVYQEIVRRIDNHEAFPHQVVAEAAKIVRTFLEDYHEKLEEEYVFPRVEKNKELTELVNTLKDQHQTGRLLTDYILAHSSEADLKDDIQKMILADYMRLYIRMFRPHEAREDTIIFPAFRTLLSQKEYMKLGDIFEEREHKLFGEEGFEKTVGRVENLEKQLNIYTLSEFTPQLSKSVAPIE